MAKKGNRISKGFTRLSFAEALAKVCPSDAEFDLHMQRLLERMDSPPAKEQKL